MITSKQKGIQFLRFCTVGAANTAVDFAVFFVLTTAGIPYLPAQVFSYAAGVANSFLLNRKWTFQITRKATGLEVAKFMAVNGVTLLISSGLLFAMHDTVHMVLWLSKVAATGGALLANYAGIRLWVFSEKGGSARSEAYEN